MALRVFQQSYHVPGALGAAIDIAFTAPFDMQLIHVSAVGSNSNAATFTIGTTSDDDLYLDDNDVGDSLVPACYDHDDFVGGEFPHIVKGTVVEVTVDYNGPSAGTAVADLTIVLTFTEG